MQKPAHTTTAQSTGRQRGTAHRRAVITAAFAVASLVLAGCGGGEEDGVAQAAAGGAPASTSDSSTATTPAGTTSSETDPAPSGPSTPLVPAPSTNPQTNNPSTGVPSTGSTAPSTGPSSPISINSRPPTTGTPTTLTMPPSTTGPSIDPAVQCLYDTWTLSNGWFASDITAAAGGRGTDAISGTATVTFKRDGSMITQYDQWTHEITTPEGGKATVVRNGTDTGTFTATPDGHLSMQEVSVGSVVTMTIAGRTIRKDGVASGPTDAIFDCTADSDIMTISQGGNDLILGRGDAVK